MSTLPPTPKNHNNGDGFADAQPSLLSNENSTSMTSSGSLGGDRAVTTRQRRRSAGHVVTERDRLVLGFIGEMYGARYSHLRALNFVVEARVASDTAVRRRVDRLEDLGLVSRRLVLGQVWVTLTRKGAEVIGETWVPWQVPMTRVQHCDAVNTARLWYESSASRVAASGAWVSERLLYRERARASGNWHISDAELRDESSGRTTALEVELHLKTPRTRYVDEVFAHLRADVSVVLYFSPPSIAASVRASVEWAARSASAAALVQVATLPKFDLRALRPFGRSS
ncbi:hypothetical protein GCM10009814_05490 [Lapillicoccus jejuensis]